MKIRITHDYQGHLSGPHFWTMGTVVEVDDDLAKEMIALHHAEPVEIEAVQATPEPEAPTTKRSSSPRKSKPKAKADDGA